MCRIKLLRDQSQAPQLSRKEWRKATGLLLHFDVRQCSYMNTKKTRPMCFWYILGSRFSPLLFRKTPWGQERLCAYLREEGDWNRLLDTGGRKKARATYKHTDTFVHCVSSSSSGDKNRQCLCVKSNFGHKVYLPFAPSAQLTFRGGSNFVPFYEKASTHTLTLQAENLFNIFKVW